MLSKRRTWLERIANWGTALAVPLVAIVGFKLLSHARDAAEPVATQGGATLPAAPTRVLAPPIDAAAPPVVELKPAPAAAGSPAARPAAGASADDPRCEALEHEAGRAGEAAPHASDSAAANRLHDRGPESRAEARRLRCRTR